MPLPNTEAQQDTEPRVVELVCGECGDAWTVLVPDGADLTDDQLSCPTSDCDGAGVEL